jgi:hypothetical protein
MAVLNVEKWGAVGILEGLWHFTARYAPAGDIGRHTDEDIARFLGWSGNAATLVSGLAKAGWIDRCPCHRARVHDWPDHADLTARRDAKFNFLTCYQTMPADTPPPQPAPEKPRAELGFVSTDCLARSTVMPTGPGRAGPGQATPPVGAPTGPPADPRPDVRFEDALRKARWGEERELLRTAARIGELSGRDPPEVMRQVTAYKRRDGTVVPGRVNPAELTAERVTKSLADAQAWLADLEAKREAGRAGKA